MGASDRGEREREKERERERERRERGGGRENNGNVSAYTGIPSLSMHAQCTMVHVMST